MVQFCRNCTAFVLQAVVEEMGQNLSEHGAHQQQHRLVCVGNNPKDIYVVLLWLQRVVCGATVTNVEIYTPVWYFELVLVTISELLQDVGRSVCALFVSLNQCVWLVSHATERRAPPATFTWENVGAIFSSVAVLISKAKQTGLRLRSTQRQHCEHPRATSRGAHKDFKATEMKG